MRIMTSRLIAPVFCGFSLLSLPVCAPPGDVPRTQAELPAIISGMALSFARAVGEFGSLVLITGNLPFKTEVGSVYVFGQIESDNLPAAAAVAVVLLLAALVVLGALALLSRWSSKHVL